MKATLFIISFLVAFLLFAVQPMSTKMVLPVLGGTPAVWNTVMFTFQLLLLGGYIYAHLVSRLASRIQFMVHAVLALAACALLPLTITLTTSDALMANPIPYLVAAFMLQVGLPFFVLSATAPLLQSWVSRSSHPMAKTPYVLYSASNLGSFAGLIGYVLLVEPLMTLHGQSHGWSVLYVCALAVLLAVGMRLAPRDPAPLTATNDEGDVTWAQRLLWMGLAFLPSSLNLGVTTYITTDIASIPLLWVIPLSIYLLSYVDAFRSRPLLVPLFQRTAPILGLAALMLYGFGGYGFTYSYLFQLLAFAALAFAIHGWLAARQPAPRHLTQFYVCLSVGGALGGVLNGLIAPMILREALEYPLVLIMASVVAFVLLQLREDGTISAKRHALMLSQTATLVIVLGAGIYVATSPPRAALDSQTLIHSAAVAALVSLIIYRRYVRAVYACVTVACVLVLAVSNGVMGNATLFKDRSFFGMLRVYENPKTNARYLMHDTTMHGVQSLDPAHARDPQAYYASVGEVLKHHATSGTRPIAVTGLGIGTLKCLAKKGQKIDLYEINPMSQKLAEDARFFTYMRDCPGEARVLLGDGRIRLAQQPNGYYGAIIMDAFSSDAIPSHLLTQEALNIYFDKLAPTGILLFHTSNRHVDLWPLLAAQAKALDLTAYGKFFEVSKNEPLRISSYWVLMARSPYTLAPYLADGWKPLVDEGERPWTDDYVNLLPFFKVLR
jgi:spermidine synthase